MGNILYKNQNSEEVAYWWKICFYPLKVENALKMTVYWAPNGLSVQYCGLFCWLTQAPKQHVALHWVGTNLPQRNNSMDVQAQLCACESEQQRKSATEIGGRIKTTSGQVLSSCIHHCLEVPLQRSQLGCSSSIIITHLTNLIFIEDPYIIHRTRPNYWMTHRCTTAETEEEKKNWVRSTDQILFCHRDFNRSNERTGTKIKPNINNSPVRVELT